MLQKTELPPPHDQATALGIFLSVWTDGMLLSDIGSKLSCREADALADLLLSNGYANARAILLVAHADGDEEGDDPAHLQLQAMRRRTLETQTTSNLS